MTLFLPFTITQEWWCQPPGATRCFDIWTTSPNYHYFNAISTSVLNQSLECGELYPHSLMYRSGVMVYNSNVSMLKHLLCISPSHSSLSTPSSVLHFTATPHLIPDLYCFICPLHRRKSTQGDGFHFWGRDACAQTGFVVELVGKLVGWQGPGMLKKYI